LNYGKIESISPVAIYKQEDIYLPLPLSYDKKVEKLASTALIHGNKQSSVRLEVFKKDIDKNGKELETKSLQAYSYKDEYKYGSSNWLVSEKGEVVPLLFSEEKGGVLIPHEQIGIDKKRKEEAFYKLTAYRMATGFSFGFYVTLKEDRPPFQSGEEQMVTLGGERSQFSMTIKAVAPTPTPTLPNTLINNEAIDALTQDQHPKLMLTSDAFVDMELLYQAKPLFVMGKPIAFRYKQTSNATQHYHNKLKSKDENGNAISHQDLNKGFQFSDRLQLLKKGSVIYVEESEKKEVDEHNTNPLQDIKKLLEAANDFRTIGYNQFIEFK
jgi:hypothetical protein